MSQQATPALNASHQEASFSFGLLEDRQNDRESNESPRRERRVLGFERHESRG